MTTTDGGICVKGLYLRSRGAPNTVAVRFPPRFARRRPLSAQRPSSLSKSSSAKVMPPTALISHSPSVPSEPLPESTTPIARACWACAKDRNR